MAAPSLAARMATLMKHTSVFPSLEPEGVGHISHLFQILRGVCYCHSQKVLHQDLKPHNLLLDRQTSSLELADFGLARTFDGAPDEYPYEVGTLAYKAPELILEMKQTTTAADIWSVGCIFAKMVNGTPPFDTKIDVHVMRNIISILGVPTKIEWPGVTSALREFCAPDKIPTTLPRLADVFPSLEPEGVDLISKMLCFVPGKRNSAHGALQHPYFKNFLQNTQLLDVFYTPRLSFEWMDKDIAKLIQFGPISAAPIKHLLLQILRGVYCHSQKVLHRCLKPHNLLLDGQTSSLKLADFGLARTFDGAPAEYSNEVGTLAYVAPELILGMQQTTIAAHIFVMRGLIFSVVPTEIEGPEVALREFCARNKILLAAFPKYADGFYCLEPDLISHFWFKILQSVFRYHSRYFASRSGKRGGRRGRQSKPGKSKKGGGGGPKQKSKKKKNMVGKYECYPCKKAGSKKHKFNSANALEQHQKKCPSVKRNKRR